MYKDCGQGNSTKSGLIFEKETSISSKLKLQEKYKDTTEDEVICDGKVIGLLLPKYKLYKFLKSKNINWKEKLSLGEIYK